MVTCAAVIPALGQAQYPPVTGGGNSGTGGNTGTTGTQSSPGPFCDLAHCLQLFGEVGGTFVANTVEELGDFRVTSVSGCCERGARVDIYMESERVYLGTVFAAEDGSYQATFKLPSSIKGGTHHVIADIQGCGELRRAIEVLGADAGRSNPGGSNPGGSVPDGSSPDGVSVPDGTSGTTVLGTNFRNTADGGGGILPRTGGDLLRLLLSALVLVLFGTALVLAARKRGLQYAWLRARGHRPVRRSETLALPPPEVPCVDTSRFVPYRSRVDERGASHHEPAGTTMTGWRAPRNDSLS